MAQELGESVLAWGRDVLKMAEDFAANMKTEQKPFYIVYCAKQDRHDQQVFRQTIKAYYSRPPAMLGILVWFVDHSKGIFNLVPELSAPPDVPLDERLLSNRPEDFCPGLVQKASSLGVLVS